MSEAVPVEVDETRDQVDLTIVVPVYNEEESLPPLCEKLDQVLSGLTLVSEIVFVDDGSTDGTFEVITELARQYHPRVRAIRFRRNYRKAAALAAGFREARGDVIVTMDGDLQDDPDEISHEAQLAMTDFLQEIQFRRALQGELEKTLSGIENVRNARVHLVMPEESLFADERLRRIRPPASQWLNPAVSPRLP